MQTLKLIIPGSYYDSQIYSGRLYLWSTDNSILTLDWDQLVGSINVPDRLKLAMICGFQRSEYLYGDHWGLIFQDEEIKASIQRKFEDLAEKPLELDQEQLRKFCIREQDNPLPFPHADSTIYYNTLYVGSPSGIVATRCDRKSRTPVNPKPNKIWDGPTLGLTAAYSTLAISAGSVGLLEYSLKPDQPDSRGLAYDYLAHRCREPHLVVEQHSNSARWLYASTFSSSYFNEGYLADFANEEVPDPMYSGSYLADSAHVEDRSGGRKWRQRVLSQVIPSSTLFGHPTRNGAPSLTWGVHDKICFATTELVEIVQYHPYTEGDKRFTRLGTVQTEKLGDIISADSALFGFVIEGDKGLLVINSLMESMWLPNEPVNWRVFPKSKFYTNQLHIIYADHLCILSFNHDYFVDQKTKMVGIRYPKQFPRRG
jgi:hypothetical protein